MSIDHGKSLAARMERPQRHRLLQGYPAVPLMQTAAPDRVSERRLDGSLTRVGNGDDGAEQLEPPLVEIDRQRQLIVGVIPHTMCRPKVHGCGFCTFPHDRYRPGSMSLQIDAVHEDIKRLLPEDGAALTGRKVAALYFGGGTANLASAEQLDSLLRVIGSRLDITEAEVSLEGVPSLFLTKRGQIVEWLAGLGLGPARLSMGVQTFDRKQIKRMGRQRFGDAKTVGRVLSKARERDLGTSVDLLYNLPYQTLDQMREDLRTAIELGPDQVCLYHLVLFNGLGTPWSLDTDLLYSRPDNREAAENWLELRGILLGAGFVQTTLTNFERADVHASSRAFRYENLSFTPGSVDGLGLGPLSLSTFVDSEKKAAVKFMRGKRMAHYRPLFGRGDYYFPYTREDLRLLFLTRSLAGTRVKRSDYLQFFGTDLHADFAESLDAALSQGLAELDEGELRLTPLGMFYADSVAGLLAEERAQEVSPSAAGRSTYEILNDSIMSAMG